MQFDSLPASNYPLPDLLNVLNRSFEAYLVPIEFDLNTFLNMIRKDGIDLTISRVLTVAGQPCGLALLARRGTLRASRLAAMGIARETRGQGAGSWFMNELLREARQRHDQEMVLEVIEQNEPAAKLYRNVGFQTVRRLVGFIRRGNAIANNESGALHKIDLRKLGRLVFQYGFPDLPWQLSGESIALMNPPACAYQKGAAYLAISNPEAENVAIWSLLVEPQSRGGGLSTAILKSVMASHTDKTWHVPAIFPEEFEKVFEKADFEKEALSQWQMKCSL